MKVYLNQIRTESCKIYFEHQIHIDGLSCLLIFGHHANGGFICIPNWGISCEACDRPNHVSYNTEKLITTGLDSKTAKNLSTYIDSWLTNRTD